MRRALLTAALLPALAGLAACEAGPVAPEPASVLDAEAALGATAAEPVRAHGDLLKAVRQATARFNSTTQAIRAGYNPDFEHCAAHPVLGGMGYHWVNGNLVDPVFDPMQPEAVLYARGPGGNMKLVAVEYIVINVGQPQPHFDGHPFDVEGVPPLMAEGVPHWSLHVWVHEDNPSGVFTPFNPNISCD
jgi:hypothetical protein